jgi:hypothetical protein
MTHQQCQRLNNNLLFFRKNIEKSRVTTLPYAITIPLPLQFQSIFCSLPLLKI